jgi:hypothetical protein
MTVMSNDRNHGPADLTELADLVLAELMASLDRGDPSIAEFLESRGVTHGGNINCIAEVYIFALLPVDLALRAARLGDFADQVLGYLQYVLFSFIRDAAKEAGALRMGARDFEEVFKRRFKDRAYTYANAYNSAPPNERALRTSELAIDFISGVGGSVVNDVAAQHALAGYLATQMPKYRSITEEYMRAG